MKVEKFLPPPDKDSVFLEAIKPKSRENIRSFIKEESKNLPPKGFFLDVGCGYRNNHTEVVEGGSRPTLFIAMDRTNEFDHPQEGFPMNLIGDAESIPLAGESVNSILCTELLEHVEDLEGVMSELHRVLKEGGILLVTVPGSDVPLHEKNYQKDYRRFTLYQFLLLMVKHGFRLIKIKSKYTFDNRKLDLKEINILAVFKKM